MVGVYLWTVGAVNSPALKKASVRAAQIACLSWVLTESGMSEYSLQCGQQGCSQGESLPVLAPQWGSPKGPRQPHWWRPVVWADSV